MSGDMKFEEDVHIPLRFDGPLNQYQWLEVHHALTKHLATMPSLSISGGQVLMFMFGVTPHPDRRKNGILRRRRNDGGISPCGGMYNRRTTLGRRSTDPKRVERRKVQRRDKHSDYRRYISSSDVRIAQLERRSNLMNRRKS